MSNIHNNFFSPYNKESFIWLAEYNDDTFLSEYDYEPSPMGLIKHDFNEIKKDKLFRYGLIGEGLHLSFYSQNGCFNILNSLIKISFYDTNSNKEYPFMLNKKDYKDIIMFRTAENLYDPSSGSTKTSVIKYAIGYKTVVDFNDITFNLKALLHVPLNEEPIYMTFKITSNKNLSGELNIIKDSSIFQKVGTTLRENYSKEFKWVVK